MKKHPSSNPIALVLNTARAVLVIIIALLASPPAMAQQGPVIVGGRVTPIKVTIPRALMQVQPVPNADDAKTVPEGEPLPTAVPPRHQPIFDPVFQMPRKKSAQTFGPLGLGEAVSAPIVNVLGMLSSSNPPDTTGDVGPNHYIQMVNATRFQIFNKAGAPLTAPITFGTLWTPATSNTGDPIVVYDHLADRWVLTQFFTGGMYFAVSQTPDPTAGTWYLYTFNTAAGLPDYPKVTVWPDGYYMSTYESPNHGIHAFERAQMLVGAPAGFVKTTVSVLTPSAGVRDTRILPADLDGVAPPGGTPCYFLRTVDGQQDTSNPVDRIQIYEAQVNWAGPTINFPLVNTITPAAFNIMVGNRNGGGIRDMIPQPNTTATVDGLSNRPMMQLKYRLIGGVPRMVVCQTIDISGSIQPILGFTPAKEVAGIRWYQLEKPAANWTIGQQGTFGDQPPGATNESQLLHRWMGSAAMNGTGDIALAYSICNDDDTNPIFPGIRYTGRLAGDTPGTMPQGEGIIVTGTASKGANGSFGNRWGDYAQMGGTTDDNTFWFTTHVASGQTHIASFKILPNTPTVTAPTSVSTTATNVTLGGNVTSEGGSAVTERGVVYALTSVNGDPVIGGTGVTKVTSPGTTGVFTVNVNGLTTGLGYSFKAYSTNSLGTAYTTPASTFTQGAPTVTTPTSAGITASSATLGGDVTDAVGSAIVERGVVYSVTSVNADPVIGGTGVTKLTSPGTTGVFTVNASGLSQATGYSFKAYATNGAGTTYTTPVSTFTTLAVAPTVTTPTQTNITAFAATLGGNVTSDGGATITERGVVYSVTTVNGNPLIGGTGVTKVTGTGTTGIFTVNVTGLSQNTGYSFKAYAINSIGTTYTAPVSTFTTPAAFVPTVTTPTQTNITAFAATLGGNVTSDGGATVTERGVVYSVTTVNGNPLIGGTGVTKVTGTGTTGIFTVNVAGLSQNTGYSFKAYAINGIGTTYTAPVSTFTTTAAFVPTVTTPTQTAITVNSATLGGNVTSDGGATITERGVVYSVTTVNGNPLIGGTGVTKVTGTGTTGVFTVNATGLSQNTGYSFKAYAINVIGTTYTTPVSTFSTPIAVPLTGTKTVGTGGDYASLTNAGGLFDVINGNGVNGAVNIQIISNLTAETGTFALNVMSGTTPSLKIFPTGAARTVSGTNAGALIRLNAADNVTLDGSLGGTGGDRSMSVTNTNTGTASAVIWLQNNGADGATNNTIKNLNVAGNGNTQTLVGIGSGSNTISIASLGTGNNGNTIQNNSISKTQYGIVCQGASVAAKNTGTVITQNLINTPSPNHVARIGILVGFQNGIQVTQNTVDGMTFSSSPDTVGISLGITSISATSFTGNEVTNATVTRNTIGKVTNTGTYSVAGIAVASATSGTTLIANNFITGVGANCTAGDIGAGIFLGGGTGSTTQVFFNSISMTGIVTGASGADYPSYTLAIGGADPVVDVRNNVLLFTQVTNGTSGCIGYAIGTAAATFANLTSNYNVMFTTTGALFGVGKTGGLSTSGTTRTTLANWQAATGKDANSSFGSPLFISTTDLHITSLASPVSNAGTPVAGLLVDFDGATRSATTPDVGADEFGATPFPTVTTPTQTAITATTATLGGNVTDDGGTAILERGVVYSVTAVNNNPLIGGAGVSKVANAGNVGVFAVNATGLVSGTGYSFKAYATNPAGTAYTSPVSTFTTLTAQEAWRLLYFGITTNTGNAADTADPDGDGGNNLFEYVAGLVPNDPLSRFSVRIEAVALEPTKKAIIFRPLVPGRTYVVKRKISLTDPTWVTLTDILTSDNVPLQERTVTDNTAGDGAKFYQVEIILPP